MFCCASSCLNLASVRKYVNKNITEKRRVPNPSRFCWLPQWADPGRPTLFATGKTPPTILLAWLCDTAMIEAFMRKEKRKSKHKVRHYMYFAWCEREKKAHTQPPACMCAPHACASLLAGGRLGSASEKFAISGNKLLRMSFSSWLYLAILEMPNRS